MMGVSNYSSFKPHLYRFQWFVSTSLLFLDWAWYGVWHGVCHCVDPSQVSLGLCLDKGRDDLDLHKKQQVEQFELMA